jgi:hypothetical protein
MKTSYRLTDLQRASGNAGGSAGTLEISFNAPLPPPEPGPDGKPTTRKIPAVRLDRDELLRVLRPRASVRMRDQLRAVVPLAAYLARLQILVLRQLVVDSALITAGLIAVIVAVIVGLMFFMEGLRIGLMSPGESIGGTLPTRSLLPLVLVVGASVG